MLRHRDDRGDLSVPGAGRLSGRFLNFPTKAPWFTLAAGTALALGIGASTTVFTLVNAVLFRGLPFDDLESIVAVWTENVQNQQSNVSHPNYLDLRDHTPPTE